MLRRVELGWTNLLAQSEEVFSLKVALAFFCLFACSVPVLAQTAAQTAAQTTAQTAASPSTPAPVKDPVASSLRLLLTRSQNNTVGAIDAMPGDKFSYKPTPDQITFAHLAAHIANSNNFLCAKAANVDAPKVDEAKDTDAKDKLLAAVKASFEFCGQALGKMDDSHLSDTVELFGGRQFPRAMAALGLASGWADHYAAAAMYLRLNNIMPPSAQPKK
jgi:hypothetical protein